jgi:pyrroline-5-carboxylate reductase
MKLGIIGVGNMGSAIIEALINSNFCTKEDIISLEKHKKNTEALGIHAVDSTIDLLSKLQAPNSILILAVKPQSFPSLAKSLKKKVDPNTTVISIMAGISIKKISEFLSHQKIIRAMPNTPALIKESMTVWHTAVQSNLSVLSSEEITNIQHLFSSFGRQLQVKDEKMLDAATAISGSGPAYLFTLAEAWTQSAIDLGFTKRQATLLVQQTIKGSQKLMEQSNDSPTTLKKKVTSKGGTTETAINYLKSKKWKVTFKEAIEAAYRKSQELNR